jgi:putative hydrolase of the HAD superfamily
MNRIRAVTLDAAGTLIRLQRPVGETYALMAREHGIPVDAEDIGRAFRTVFPRMSPLAFGSTDRKTLERQERSWWRTLVRGCLGRHGQHPAFGAYFSDLYAYYGDAGAWALYPEVMPLLQRLEGADVAAAVVSNFDTRLHAVLEQLGVHGRFRAVLCSTEVGAAKPDPRIFQSACARLRTDAAATLHVGDDRRADLEGARGAGLEARWVQRGTVPQAGSTVIPDLSAIPGLVGARPG